MVFIGGVVGNRLKFVKCLILFFVKIEFVRSVVVFLIRKMLLFRKL